MSEVPEFMPILSKGAHTAPSKGACIMEYASFLNGEEWTDKPSCTHPVLAEMARNVNDRLPDDRRQALLSLLPRLMGTNNSDQVLSVRLAVWCAQQVVHLSHSNTARVAIESALAWCDNPCEKTAYATYATYAAYATYTADAATYATAAAYAANAATYATAAAYATYAAGYSRNIDLVDLLTGLINEYDRLTGRDTTVEVTEDDLRRCAELTSVK